MDDAQLVEAVLREMGAKVPDDLINFGGALSDADWLDDGWAYFLEKPWKWTAEYVLWADLDKPRVGDAKWEQFYAALGALA